MGRIATRSSSRFPARLRVLACAALAAALVPAWVVSAEDAPKDGPKPPTTPLPTFENPLWDAQPGETLLYGVRDLEGKWTRYFEERVLARDKDQILIETVETDATGAKTFARDPDPRNTGWKPLSPDMKLGSVQSWVRDREKDEVVVVGDPPRAAVRCRRRVIDEPADLTRPDGKRHQRQVWYSHDVPCTGRVKMFPAQGGGERMAISWDKRLSAEECQKRAALIKKPEPAPDKPGMDDAGMAEPGMDEPGMGEPGKEKPEEPGMSEPGMGEPGMEAPGTGEK